MARLAMIVPPVQSLFVGYAGADVLATYARDVLGAEVLVVDCGMDWLEWRLRAEDGGGWRAAWTALREPATFVAPQSLLKALGGAAEGLARMCEPWAPESVTLPFGYTPPLPCSTWEEVALLLRNTEGRDLLFDQYFRTELVPRLDAFRPDVIGLSIPFAWMLLPAMRLVRHLRRSRLRGTIVVGGPVIGHIWRSGDGKALQLLSADFAVSGPGEEPLATLLRSGPGRSPESVSGLLDLRGGPVRFVREVASTTPLKPMLGENVTRRYMVPSPVVSVPASRGCFFGRCAFCSRHSSSIGSAYSEVSAESLADAMRSAYLVRGVSRFVLAGDVVSPELMLGVADRASRDPPGVRWFCEATLKGRRTPFSPGESESLFRGGCRVVMLGLESASASVRDRMGCQLRRDVFETTIENFVRSGILPFITLVVGYPGETLRELQETLDFATQLQKYAVVSMSIPEIMERTPLMRLLSRGSKSYPPSILGAAHYRGPEAQRARDAVREGRFPSYSPWLRSVPILMQLAG